MAHKSLCDLESSYLSNVISDLDLPHCLPSHSHTRHVPPLWALARVPLPGTFFCMSLTAQLSIPSSGEASLSI